MSTQRKQLQDPAECVLIAVRAAVAAIAGLAVSGVASSTLAVFALKV